MPRTAPRPAPSRAGTTTSPDVFPGFSPDAIRFFRSLRRHNTREWFAQHRARYEDAVLTPMRLMVEEVDDALASVAPEIVGDPRRSLFRIHRDVRFSADKSPYKTNAACWFFHRDAGRGVGQSVKTGAAGFYFHLEPGRYFLGGGIWMPPRPALQAIREAIAERHEEFTRFVRARAFRRVYGALDDERMLQRVPRGYAPDHPAAHWLRYVSFTATRDLSEGDVHARTLPSRLVADFEVLLPLVRWLNDVLGYPATERR
ncbi:MAG TPA: DUF2461 domain-containing protein [Gemmatimonadaceae bacterium]|nr:DUF2461 domain-containing protein [Gemmatimonadaceae bacterium]